MAGAVSPPETLAGFEATVTQWLKQNGSPVTLTKMKGVSGWLLALPEGPTLQVFREEVTPSTPACDQCRILGWGGHPVSPARYHFIIPAETGPGSLADPTSLAAIAAASARGRALALAQTALASPPPDDPAAQSYTAPASVFECPRHVLHGMVHGNGYGHLLRVNGVEGQGGAAGSGPRISGRTVMLLWTQLCARLAATAISTEDVSNKGGMDLRVLHTAAHLSTWYGQFGFDFGRGAYNITREQWAEAARAVHAAPLRSLVDDFHGVDDAVVDIVQRYGLPMEEPEVGVQASPATLGPLLQRMLRLSSSAGDARAFFDERAVAAARAAAVASALAAAAPARGGKGRPTATTRGKRGAPAGKVARKKGAGEAVVPGAGRQAAGGMARGPLGPPPGSHIRVYIKSRRTYYNVCVLGFRQPDGAARAPEYQVQYHSGAIEWMGLEDMAWSHVAKPRVAGKTPAQSASASATRRSAQAECAASQAESHPGSGLGEAEPAEAEGPPAKRAAGGPKIALGCGRCRQAPGGCATCRARALQSMEALGCLAAFEQHLGCERCSGGPPGCSHCWKAALADLRVLRDCKLFVRDVRPAWAPPPSGMLRVALSTQLPPNFQLAHSRTRPSPRKGTASPVAASCAPNNHHPSHISPPTPATVMRQLPLAPPPLALDLPADVDLGGTALAFTAALGEAYVAFQNYVPLILLPSPGASGWKAVPAATDATRLATLLPETACSAEAGGLRLLWMGGKGLDRNPAWWRQGGHEDWVVACSCGTRDDDGERMLSCDACGRWHHWRCAGLAEADPDPAAWQCPSCSPG